MGRSSCYSCYLLLALLPRTPPLPSSIKPHCWLVAWPVRLTWTMAWTWWKKWTLHIFGCSTWIDTDRPGANPILKRKRKFCFIPSTVIYVCQPSFMSEHPPSFFEVAACTTQCCKVSPEQKSVSSLKVESCLKVSSQVESCRGGCRWWRLSLPHPVVATCRHPDVPERRNVTPSPAECRQVSPLRPGGLEPAAASVLEPAGRRRLRTGTCD